MDRKTMDIDLSSAASAMSKKRWSALSEEQRKAAMDKARAERQRKVSKTRRLEIAKAAAKARWAKAHASKPAGEPAGTSKRSAGDKRDKRKAKNRP
jgi:TRAP-type C4-dicarboxylate transport system substrate-binding protein